PWPGAGPVSPDSWCMSGGVGFVSSVSASCLSLAAAGPAPRRHILPTWPIIGSVSSILRPVPGRRVASPAAADLRASDAPPDMAVQKAFRHVSRLPRGRLDPELTTTLPP